MTVQTYSKEYVEGLIAEKVILREGLCDIAKRAITDLNSTYEHMAADTLRKANFAQTSQSLGGEISSRPESERAPTGNEKPPADSKQRSFVVRSRQSVDPDELDEQGQCEHRDRRLTIAGWDCKEIGCGYQNTDMLEPVEQGQTDD